MAGVLSAALAAVLNTKFNPAAGRAGRRRAAVGGLLVFRSTTGSGGGTNIAKPSGSAVGDVVFIAANSPSASTVTTSGGSTWSTSSFGTTTMWWKVLNATDVANAWAFDAATGASVAAYIGNGAATVTAKGTASVSGSSMSYAGYTPAPSAKGSVVYEQAAGGGTITEPAGWTTASGVNIPNNNGALGGGFSLYKTDYAGGAIAFSYSSAPSSADMIVFEVT